MDSQPLIILLFSGKRKSGKDYFTNELLKLPALENKIEVLKISQPIKSYWAIEKNLNLKELLSDSEYKEQYRQEMIKWSDEMRAQDYGYFCRAACENAQVKQIWMVSDIRRKTDIKWFKEKYGDLVKSIRILADEETRMRRGYKFRDGVDNVPSECDLDDYIQWDLVIDNSEGSKIDKQINDVYNLITSSIID